MLFPVEYQIIFIENNICMKTFNNIPVYKAQVNSEDEGMFVVSLVDEPAIEVNFLAFDKQQEFIKLKIQDEEQQKVLGPVMVPDMLIYRRKDNFEYYIQYDEQTIRQMAEKFFAERRINDVDTQHNFELEPGVVMTQAFFKDTEKGVNPQGFEDLPNGTLFMEYHITDPELWERVKSGELKGFSLAGVFDIEPVNNSNELNKMTKLKQIKQALAEAILALNKITTDRGVLSYDGEELEVGVAVYVVDEEGNESKPEDGDYETDTQVIKVEDGRITEINEIEKVDEPGEPQEEVEASAEPDEPGEPAEEPVEEPKCTARERFNKIQALFEESYEEKTFKIADAIRALGVDCWVVECGDDYAIAEVWNEETATWDKHWRYDISWDEEGNAIASNPVEVKSEYVPVDEDREEIIANLRSEVETLKAQLKEPAAEPAQEQFRKSNEIKTGLSKLDKAIRILKS